MKLLDYWRISRPDNIAKHIFIIPGIVLAIIYQPFQIDYLENIFLGIEKNTLGVLNKKNYQLFHKLDKKIGFNLDPNEKIYNLRIADQQKVEIVRALARKANVIIMDEPTSS